MKRPNSIYSGKRKSLWIKLLFLPVASIIYHHNDFSLILLFWSQCTFFQFIHVDLSGIEIRRFSRKKLDCQFRWQHGNVNSSSDAVAQGPAKEMGQVKPYRPPPPWKSTSLGHIPSPKTPRAKFINSFLPEFYKTKFKHCKNNKSL